MNDSDSVWYLLPKWLAVPVVAAMILVVVLAAIADWRDEHWFVFVERPVGEVLLAEDLEIAETSSKLFWGNSDSIESSFEELLLSQNPDLRAAIAELDESRCSIQIVQAPGGYGKSGLVSIAIAEQSDGRPVYEIDLREFAAQITNKQMIGRDLDEYEEWRVDLAIDGKVINRLPEIDRSRAEALVQHLIDNANTGAIVQLDSLDEIHSSSVFTIVNSLRSRRSDLEAQGVDVVIFSRPEVIDIAVAMDNKNDLTTGIHLVKLKPHKLGPETLKLRVQNYLDYKARKVSEKEPERADQNGVVPGFNDSTTINVTTHELSQLLRSQPHLVECLRLAELSRLLIESVWSNPKQQVALPESPAAIREHFQRRLMARNLGSHLRPEKQKGLYNEALAAVAASVKIDDNGYFIPPLDVTFEYSGKQISVDGYDVLQRSHLVDVIPGKGEARLRFEPVWLRGQIALGSDQMVRVFSPLRVFIVVIATILVVALAREIVKVVSTTKPECKADQP